MKVVKAMYVFLRKQIIVVLKERIVRRLNKNLSCRREAACCSVSLKSC